MFFMGSTAQAGGCAAKAVASSFVDKNLVFTGAAAAGADTGAALAVLHEVAVGEPAVYGGAIHVSGCFDAKITVTEIIGDDCDVCTVDTLETRTYERVLPKGSTINIPPGYWQKVEAQLVDSAGDPVDLPEAATATLYLKQEAAGNCATAVLAV